MPAKTRPKRKPVPAILRTPIPMTLDVVPKLFGASTPQAEAEEKRIWKERGKRLKEVFKYYDVEASNPQDLMRLIWLMAADLFPRGFECVLDGDHKTKKTKWTLNRKIELLSFIGGHQDAGKTLTEAAESYAKIYPTLSPQGIISLFYETRKWLEAGKLTSREMLDLLERKS